jgi:hypothetical protein
MIPLMLPPLLPVLAIVLLSVLPIPRGLVWV